MAVTRLPKILAAAGMGLCAALATCLEMPAIQRPIPPTIDMGVSPK